MNSLKTEFQKGLRSRFFLVSLCAGIAFALASAAYMWNLYDSDMGVGGLLSSLKENGGVATNVIYEDHNLYNNWMGADGQSLGAALFYLLSPLLAALPCGWTFSEELHSGYLHMIVPKCGRRTYFLSKLAASFLIGGLILALPQLLNVLLTALYLPGAEVSVIYNMYYPILHGDLFSRLFYTYPLLYLLAVIGMDFLFGGFFACLSLSVAFFSRSALAAVIVPFLLLMLADSAKILIYYISYVEISPIGILHPMSTLNFVKGWMVLVWLAVLAAATIPVVWIRGCRRDIF